MRAALVTGAAGFLGRHFARELLTRDYDEVHGLDVETGDVTLASLRGRTTYRHYVQDVRDFFDGARGGVIRNLVGEVTARDNYVTYDLIVHCAAVEPHRAAIDGVNVNMSHNLEIDAAVFRWVATTGQKRLLYVSSSAVYPVKLQRNVGPVMLFSGETVNHFRLQEDHADGHSLPGEFIRVPDKSYGWTKWIGEYQARQVRELGVPVTVVRPFSGYGEDQSENFPFRAFVERARRHENPFTIWGRDDQVRDFIHVSDVVRGALAAVEVGVEVTNLCTGVGTTMMELANLCMGAAGYEADVQVDGNAPLGVASRVGDPSRMLEFYEPKVTIEEGVQQAMHQENVL